MPPSSQQFAWWPQPQQGQRHPLTPLAVTALKQEEAATGRAKGSAYSPTKRTPTKAAVPASPQQQQQDEPLTNLTQKQQEQPATTTAPEGNGTKQSSSGSDAAVGSPTTGLGPLDFVLEAVIGVGAYGKVFKATSKHTGRPFALKVIDKARLRTGKPTIAMLVKEATLLRMVDHPFVLKLHATFQTQDKVFFLTDLLSGGDCFRHEQLRGFQEAEVRHLAAQAVLALEYLHSKGILYRDMKPENLSLDAAGNLVLIDMGHGIQAATATDLAGTPEYMAPEQIYQQPHDHAVDYWRLGMTLYLLMARRHPFGKATAQHILAVEPAFDARGGFRQPLSRACVDFLSGLLRKDPRQRLADPRQIRAHPWFRGLDWAALEKKLIAPPYRPSGSLWQNFDPEFLAMPPVLDASEAGPHIPGFSYEPPAAIAAVRGTAPVVVAPNNNTGTTGSTGNSNTNTTADASANANTGSSEVNQTSRPATPASAGGMAQPPLSSSSAAGVAPSGGGQPYPGAAAHHLHHYHPHHSHHGHGHHGHHDHWRRVPNTTSSAPAPVAAPASQQQPNQQPNSRIVTMTA